MSSSHTVLIADDEPELTDLYATWFDEEYDVRTAYSGKSAISQFDSDVSVVFLDRRMPTYNGDKVLEDIRAHEHDCPVAMLTAVDPDVDIVDLPFDEYIVKPVKRDQIKETAQRLIAESQSTHNSEVLDVLGDQKARHLFSYLVERSTTAKELGEATGLSLPTIYRRLNTLHQTRLIEEQLRVDAEGNHVKAFTARAGRVSIDLANGFEVDVESLPEREQQ
jgi:DNA-binding NtrC family response regulator